MSLWMLQAPSLSVMVQMYVLFFQILFGITIISRSSCNYAYEYDYDDDIINTYPLLAVL